MDQFDMGHDSRLRSTSGTFKLDEGFAEDSQHNGDQIQNSFLAWLNTQPDSAKAEIAYEILRTLRSTEIAAVVERLDPLLHMDPIEKLPPEITAQVFSYLDASTLLTASLSSETWRERILDPRLWQDLYQSQGWGIDLNEVKAFEDAHSHFARSEFKKVKRESKGSFSRKGQPLFKRRATSDWLQSTPRRVSADVAGWREQHGIVEADVDTAGDGADEIMTDVPAQSPQRPNKRQSQDSGDEMDLSQDTSLPKESSQASNLLLIDNEGHARLNWPYVYKQRHKLEQNWLKGRYTNFQLPHPNYPQEAHTECVYTIQFFGKWLVSGSRDHTLRVWDLDTRRLRGKPLLGHSQSVLCLQFDPTEEEDIIISGSSDSSIVVWKFSTGQRLHTINSAHEESVLNLRFDRRYLVTCSKDKKIKIWSRKSLLPTDPDYPRAKEGSHCRIPSHILDLTQIDISMLEAGLANGAYRALKPYSHLMTFEGHNAAVNAIQIHENKIVSASGDRLIRIWDINTGQCLRAVPGHQKGIACVQYDGKRVVSGSSDNTVRIFDPVTGAEVATLLGHTNLVRTVQAGFGDTPSSDEDGVIAARAAETQYRQDVQSGKIVEDRHYQRRIRNNEFGSSRMALGSNLPPGGGGSKWARIVSGSYDESIIIWKKDPFGHWVVGQTLKQDENTQNNIEADASGEAAPRTQRRHRLRMDDPTVQRMVNNSLNLQRGNANSNTANQNAVAATSTLGSGNVMSSSQIMQAAMNTSIASFQTSVQNIMGLSRTLGVNIDTSNGRLDRPAIQNAVNQLTAQAQAVTNQAISTALINAQANINANIAAGGLSRQAQGQSQPGIVPTPVQAQAQAQAQTQVSAPVQASRPQQNPAPHAQAAQRVPHLSNPTNSRVFKIQFDARRIVCCSQDSRIIGWDFANGDPEIEECGKFFLGP